MKRVAALSLIMGLFYPDLARGISFKKLPVYCSSALRSLSRGDVKSPAELVDLANIEAQFDSVPLLDYDPIVLARNKVPILTKKDLALINKLPPKSKAYIIAEYTEYFTHDQLLSLTQDSSFKDGTRTDKIILTQINKFKEMVDGATYFDDSLEKKYTTQFSSESAEISQLPELTAIIGKSIQKGHDLLYIFFQYERNKVFSTFNSIGKEIDTLATDDLKRRSRITDELDRAYYIKELSRNIEVNNSYFELLLNYNSLKISPPQFMSLVEQYQRFKRKLISSIIQREKAGLMAVAPRPESWNFYGEILKISSEVGLTPFQKQQLWNYLMPDVRAMAITAEYYDHSVKNDPTSTYEKYREDNKYHLLVNKILAYGHLDL